MTMQSLAGKVAVVTGASRGVGKGLALGLGEAGATVYVTGRTVEEGKAAVHLSGTVHQTAAEITALGGKGIAMPCDHRSDEQVAEVFAEIARREGRIDILGNGVWGGYEQFANGSEYTGHLPFWKKDFALWDAMQLGVRASFVASCLAIPLMQESEIRLIAVLSSEMGRQPGADIPYSCAHASMDHLAACLGAALRESKITAVSLAPGLVRTESVLLNQQYFDLSQSQSPLLSGRALAALAQDPQREEKSGEWLRIDDLVQAYHLKDISNPFRP